jgi:hypothetical protein
LLSRSVGFEVGSGGGAFRSNHHHHYSRPQASSQVSKATVVAFDPPQLQQVEGFTPKTPHSLQMDEEEKGHHHPGMLETRDRVFRFVEKSNGVAATASPHALDSVSFSNTATECASVEPPCLATIQAQYKMFLEPCVIKALTSEQLECCVFVFLCCFEFVPVSTSLLDSEVFPWFLLGTCC